MGTRPGLAAVAAVCCVATACAQGPAIEPDLQGRALAAYRTAAGLEREGKTEEAAEQWEKLLAMAIPDEVAWQIRSGLMPVGLRQVTAGACAYPCISPDGRRLICGWRQIRVQDLADPRTMGVVPLPGLANAGCPDWSPDGSLIAVHTLTDQGNTVSIWQWSTDELPGLVESDIPGMYPRFSSDGTWLLLSAVPRLGVAARDLLGGAEQTVPWNAERGARNHAAWWSDDKSFVFHAYTADDLTDRALYRLGGTDPDKITALVEDGKFNCHPSVSPLGNGVAYYYATDTTTGVLCLVSGDGRYRVELCEGITPRWSPDGRHLVFRGNNARGYLMQMGGRREFPVAVAATVGRESAAVTLAAGAEPAEVTVRTALYGPDGIAVVQYPWSEETLAVPAGQVMDVLVPLEADLDPGDYVLKVTVEAAETDGQREVRMLDWVVDR